MIYVFWTCRDLEEGRRVARGLVERRLIACASLIPHVESIYRWEGKIEQGNEAKAILKTKKELFEDVKAYILEHCSYEVPEICAVNIDGGNLRYLQWVANETSMIK